MGKPVSVIQQSFAGGEWAPSLYARTDLAKYRTAVRTMKNFIIHPHGHVKNRGGTYFITEVKDSSKKTRLIPFQYSAGDAYIIELGYHYIRIITDAGFVSTAPGSGTDIVKASTYKWTVLATTPLRPYILQAAAGGDPAISRPSKVYEDADGTPVELTEVTDIINAAQGTWAWHDYGSYYSIAVRMNVGGDPDLQADGYLEACYSFELVTTYGEDDIFDIKFAQDGDDIYLAHPSYAPRKLTRTNAYSWAFATVSFATSQAAPTNLARSAGSSTGNNYVVTAVSSDGEESVPCTALTNKGPGDTFTWTAASGADYYNVYKDSNGSTIYGWIGRADSTTFKEPASWLDPDYLKTPPIAQTVFGSTNNYPAAVAFFQQRLCFAGSNNDPNKVWGSRIGAYANHNKSIPVLDDDAFTFTIPGDRIRWLASLRELIVGTAGAENRMAPAIDESTITPSNVIILKESSWGASTIAPLIVGNELLFVDATKRVIRSFASQINIEGYEEYAGNDLTILSSHLFEDYQIVDWTYQQRPDNTIWVVRDDGVLLGLTYFREHQIWAWHQHETNGSFESVCTLLKTDGEYATYAIVNRTINGGTKRFIEKFEERLPANELDEKDIEQAFFVDCGLSYNSPADITGATAADPVVITCVDHGLATGETIDIREVVGMTELNGNRYKVISLTDDTFSLTDEDDEDIDGTGYTAYSSGGIWRKAITSIVGLDHLEGEAVSVLANGVPVTGKTVTDGAITLTTAASIVHVGLGYTCDVETMDFNYDTQHGTLQDRVGTIASVMLRLVNTASLQAGPDEDNLTTIDFEDAELLNGDKEVMLISGTHRECRVFCRVEEPLPCQIIALIARVLHGDY